MDEIEVFLGKPVDSEHCPYRDGDMCYYFPIEVTCDGDCSDAYNCPRQ